MRPRDALREGARILAAAPGDSGTASLDASLILAELLGTTRAGVYSAPDDPLPGAILERYHRLLALRAAGRPLAYLLGRKEFYGRDFLVSEAVLVPRPDTELLVEAALAAGDEAGGPREAPLAVHECCVGSGAVALSLAAERPAWRVSASDISAEALAVAAENLRRLLPPERPGGPPALFRSDLLASLPEGSSFDLILANPPYVPSEEARDLAASWGEPLVALDGGGDGLDLCRRLLLEAPDRLSPGGSLLIEADPSQAEELRKLFATAGFVEVRSLRDLAGHERVTLGRKPWKN